MTRIPDAPMEGGILNDAKAQTSAHRRRPLVQYVVTNPAPFTFEVRVGPAGSKPSHELIDKPRHLGTEMSIERARALIPAGYKRLARRKDDRADVVEVWV